VADACIARYPRALGLRVKAGSMTRTKKILVAYAIFLVMMIFAPIAAWIFLDLEGTEAAQWTGFMIFTGLAIGGLLGWGLIEKIFFGE
jgi:hypothetical protein